MVLQVTEFWPGWIHSSELQFTRYMCGPNLFIDFLSRFGAFGALPSSMVEVRVKNPG